MKQVIILCGLIGSGKTTYAQKNYKAYTDLDEMVGYVTKNDQIKLTMKLLKDNDTVCHITTIPTQDEIEAFKELNHEYLWIDTSLNQCTTNILIRNRERDMSNLTSVIKANEDLMQDRKTSLLKFKNINVFKTNKT